VLALVRMERLPTVRLSVSYSNIAKCYRSVIPLKQQWSLSGFRLDPVMPGRCFEGDLFMNDGSVKHRNYQLGMGCFGTLVIEARRSKNSVQGLPFAGLSCGIATGWYSLIQKTVTGLEFSARVDSSAIIPFGVFYFPAVINLNFIQLHELDT